MKYITVGARTQYRVKVSDEDYDYLITLKWTFAVSHPRHGGLVYARRSIWVPFDGGGGHNVTVFMHHVILDRMGKVRPSDKHTCDHDNGRSLDNRRENLFWRTHKEQMAKDRRRGIRARPIGNNDAEAVPF